VLVGEARRAELKPILETVDLVKYFPMQGTFLSRSREYAKVIDGVSIKVEEGKSTAIVGESGSGKTTLGRLIMRFIEPTSGKIIYDGNDITEVRGKKLKAFRREMQMIFQDPSGSLNPRKTIEQLLSQPFRIQKVARGAAREEMISNLLESVGLNPPERFLERYPHELSGGQKQRVVIARAVALRPRFVLADEPVSSLDVSVRAQILKLMNSLQAKMGLTYLMITHDLAVVRAISSTIFVMYLGRVVETVETEELFLHPLHPYTQALIAAAPIPDPELAEATHRVPLAGDPPSPINIPPGCRFAARCPRAFEKCSQDPPLKEVRDNHFVACWLY
jgi:oligopeptide/dipeptide ABC transporter ATP-binding protein